MLPGVREASVVDGDSALHLRWDAPGRDDLCSLVLWRNLRGRPAGRPRSGDLAAPPLRLLTAFTPIG